MQSYFGTRNLAKISADPKKETILDESGVIDFIRLIIACFNQFNYANALTALKAVKISDITQTTERIRKNAFLPKCQESRSKVSKSIQSKNPKLSPEREVFIPLKSGADCQAKKSLFLNKTSPQPQPSLPVPEEESSLTKDKEEEDSDDFEVSDDESESNVQQQQAVNADQDPPAEKAAAQSEAAKGSFSSEEEADKEEASVEKVALSRKIVKAKRSNKKATIVADDYQAKSNDDSTGKRPTAKRAASVQSVDSSKKANRGRGRGRGK